MRTKSILFGVCAASVLAVSLFVLNPFFQHRHQMHNSFTNKVGSDFKQLKFAAELYKNDTGSYPQNLETLLPKYIYKLPEDPWGASYQYSLAYGKPLFSTYGADMLPGGKDLKRDLNSKMNVKDYLK